MKSKEFVKVLLAVLLLLIILALLTTAYFIFIDIESKEPKEIKETCQLQIETYIGRKVFVITPKNGTTNDLKILYFHGGAYVAEASKAHWDFIEKIVQDTGATVIMPDYPLTPKYNYKDVFTMIVPLYKEIIEKVNAKDVIIAGDSAGGGMSLALLEKIKEDREEMPRKTLLISPWLDTKLKNDKIDEVQKFDKKLNKETLALAGIAYAGENGMDSYLVNPLQNDLSNLNQITIFTGTYDILNPDVHVLKEKAEQVEGTQIDIKEYEKAEHIWIVEQNTTTELGKQAYLDFIQEIKNNKSER